MNTQQTITNPAERYPLDIMALYREFKPVRPLWSLDELLSQPLDHKVPIPTHTEAEISELVETRTRQLQASFAHTALGLAWHEFFLSQLSSVDFFDTELS